MSNQLLLATSNTPSTVANSFIPPLGYGGLTPNATEANVAAVVAAPGLFKSMRVRFTTAAGAGASWQFILSVNGTPSALSVTVSGASAVTGTATTDVAVVAGDVIAIKIIPTGPPVAAGTVRVLTEFAPTVNDQYIYPGGCVDSLSAATKHAPLLNFRSVFQATDTDSVTRSIVPIASTLKSFYVNLTVAPGAGTSWDFIIMVDGVESAATTLNIANTATTGNLTGLSVALIQGTKLTFKCKTRTGATAATICRWGVVIQPTVSGTFIMTGAAGGGSLNNAATEYQLFSPITTDGDTVESRRQVDNYLAADLSLSGLTVAINTAPGATKSWAFNLRKNTAPGTGLVTITDPSTSGVDTTHTDVIAAGGVFALEAAPTLTPTATSAMWAIGGKLTLSPGGGGGGGRGGGGHGGGGGTPGGGGGGTTPTRFPGVSLNRRRPRRGLVQLGVR